MQEQISKIKERFIQKINEISDLQNLADLKVKYLGKKGELTAISKQMATIEAALKLLKFIDSIIEQFWNISLKLFNWLLITKLETLRYVNEEQKLNIFSIFVTFLVSKLAKFNDVNFSHP